MAVPVPVPLLFSLSIHPSAQMRTSEAAASDAFVPSAARDRSLVTDSTVGGTPRTSSPYLRLCLYILGIAMAVGLTPRQAKEYILDPLTAPEPHQESAMVAGTSISHPPSCRYGDARARPSHASPCNSPRRQGRRGDTDAKSKYEYEYDYEYRYKDGYDDDDHVLEHEYEYKYRYPTPPSSKAASPTATTAAATDANGSDRRRGRHHWDVDADGKSRGVDGKGDFARDSKSKSKEPPSPSRLPPSNPYASAGDKPATSLSQPRLRREPTALSLDEAPPPAYSETAGPSDYRLRQPRLSQQPRPPQKSQGHRRYLSVPTTASSSAPRPDSCGPSSSSSSKKHAGNHHHHHQYNQRSRSTNASAAAPFARDLDGPSSHLARYPGDMAHRPLDMIRANVRQADRGPHRHRKRISETDTIDALDTIGGRYHHGGPYDATLVSRNLDKRYSPVAAVQATNMEALRATPRENIIDSLERHVPLQGTSSIPAGDCDMSGNVMRYNEGADLMREPDAEGGAYKRWAGVNYHPDDLKGKGEPSFTIERDLKAGKRRSHLGIIPDGDAIEMQSGVNDKHKDGTIVMERSLSNVPGASSSGTIYGPGPSSATTALGRSRSTGHKLSDGIKRRFGSLRHHKSPAVDEQ
ncbi:hypothetical protein RJ55_01513 [Drechmeria coniospora]|nr:hypothetical protein RJ55_01513 [Drechmeria coniospora]